MNLVEYRTAMRTELFDPRTFWSDADGFCETLRVGITFDTAPASGEVVEIY